jgi:hypothetical protein
MISQVMDSLVPPSNTDRWKVAGFTSRNPKRGKLPSFDLQFW